MRKLTSGTKRTTPIKHNPQAMLINQNPCRQDKFCVT